MRLLSILVVSLVLCAPCLRASAASASNNQDKLFQQIIQKARTLAGQPYSPPDTDKIPQALKNLDYDQYQDIRFARNQALWRGQALFNVEFFHLGFHYLDPVIINQVVNGNVSEVPYNPALFTFGANKNLSGKLSSDLGFAGFRIHYPLNRPDYKDEVIAFLGASYFRMVGRGQSYGISARGLAIDTATSEGEEFPRFTEFWLVRPAKDDTSMTFYALLDSKSVTGAYRFVLTPGADTTLQVTAHLVARKDVDKLGIAPLTSMFDYGENRVRFVDDYRPEVHDSDGLLDYTGGGLWIWRPLRNPKKLSISDFLDNGPRGFGLVQRDRDFSHYEDMDAHYEKRPSFWVKPDGNWGKGAVQLIEIPSDNETNDNIVAFWKPDKPFKAGEERTFSYRLETFAGRQPMEHLAHVVQTRIGWGGSPGQKNPPPHSLRRFMVEFAGGQLSTLQASQPVHAELSTSAGNFSDVKVQRLPNGHWRVGFKLHPQDGKEADMKLHLSLRGRRLSENWAYLWNPDELD